MCIYMYIYMFIYMFICTELIEETGRPPGLIFGMWGYFWPGSDKFESEADPDPNQRGGQRLYQGGQHPQVHN